MDAFKTELFRRIHLFLMVAQVNNHEVQLKFFFAFIAQINRGHEAFSVEETGQNKAQTGDGRNHAGNRDVHGQGQIKTDNRIRKGIDYGERQHLLQAFNQHISGGGRPHKKSCREHRTDGIKGRDRCKEDSVIRA